MKAQDLIQQYCSGTITARELVEGVWDNAATRFDEYGRWLFFTNNALYHAFFADSLEELYAKGAEFTISRIEEIRQVKQDVFIVELQWSDSKTRTEIHIKNAWDISARTYAIECTRWSRVLAREQAVLAELSRGVRPEVLS